jgi:hypothetical protein
MPENYQAGPEIQLSVNPNPFHDRLLISYALPGPDQISVEIRDITGKLLYHTTRQAAGKETMEIVWSNLPESSRTASGGIYLLSLRTGTRVFMKKLVRQ